MLGLRILPARLASLFALAALIALAAAALTPPPPPTTAQEPDGVPERLTLNLELLNDSDGYVQAGSTISIRGQVRLAPGHEDLQISAGDLRLTADQAWEANDRARLPLDDLSPLFLLAPVTQTVSGERIAYDHATPPNNPLGNGQQLRVIAYDGKTIVARARNHWLYIINAETGAQIGRLEAPWKSGNNHCLLRYDAFATCVAHGNNAWGFGRQSDADLGGAVDIWQENENTAWLFVGAHRYAAVSSAYNYLRIGALFIYEVNYQPASPTINLRRSIPGISSPRQISTPTINELRSKRALSSIGQDSMAWFGSAVAVSADGSTLAVGAPWMHDVGAVYVYTRPTGGWSAALGWNDAVRVEPVAIPAWGTSSSTRPFNPQSTGRTGAAADCDAYCSRVSSYTGDTFSGTGPSGQNYEHLNLRAQFGAHLALSGDGSVLAVSAPTKRFASDTPGGSGVFRNTSLDAQGEVLIFTAPTGGWSSVPNYKTGRTEFGQSASGATFDPSTGHNLGPNKRVVEPTWTFSFDWSSQQDYYLGEQLALSEDGTVLAASDRIDEAVNIFQVDSPSGWASGPTAPTAQLTGADEGGRGGEIGFSANGQLLAVGDPAYNSNQGRVLLFQRPDDGTWTSANADLTLGGVAGAEVLLAPTTPNNRQRANEYYGRTLAWGGADPSTPPLALLAVGAAEGDNRDNFQSATDTGPGRLWTYTRTGPLHCPINTRTDAEGVATRTTVCALDLGNTSIVIPTGTPDGPFTISGSVTLRYGADAEGEPLTVVRTANIELQIGDVQEVAKVQLGFATDDRGTPTNLSDDRPYPSELSASGSSTVLRLQILNEHDKASAAGSVASVIVTTTAGALSTDFGGGCGSGAVTCSINASALSADNADNIPITLTHPGREGTARISALVIATDGMSYESDPQEVVLAGVPRALEIAEPAVALLNIDTPDSGADKDDRDVLTLTVTARDRIGNPVRAADRTYSYRITGPDGKQVAASKIAVQWPAGNLCAIRAGTTSPPTLADSGALLSSYTGAEPARSSQISATANGRALCIWDPNLPAPNRWRAWETGDDDIMITRETVFAVMSAGRLTREPVLTADNQPQIRLNVNAAPTAALASGEYTLEVRQAGLPWVSRTIRLAGVPAEISFAALDEPPALNQRFTITATISDADGNPVPNGTAVEWSTVQPRGGATLVRLAADLTTTDGAASSTWLAATSGSAWVRAESGTQQQLQPVAIPAQQIALSALLSRGATPGFGVWLGSATVKASELVAGVEGVNGVSVLRSNPSRWLTYAVDNGQLRPNSLDFPIRPNDIYWLE